MQSAEEPGPSLAAAELDVLASDEAALIVARAVEALGEQAEELACERLDQTTRGEVEGTSGRALADRISRLGRSRLNLVLLLESAPDEASRLDRPQAVLALAACQLVEHEVARLLASPLRSIGDALVQATAPPARDVLAAWRSGRLAVTLATLQLLFAASRSVALCDRAAVGAAFEPTFGPRYARLVAHGGFERSVEALRTARADALDPHREVHGADLRWIARMAVGADRFSTWDAEGPVTSRGDEALLHHHVVSLSPAARAAARD